MEGKFKELSLDGVTGRIKGTAWIAHEFLTINVFDADRKKPATCPFCRQPCSVANPSGYVYTFNIPLAELKDLLGAYLL